MYKVVLMSVLILTCLASLVIFCIWYMTSMPKALYAGSVVNSAEHQTIASNLKRHVEWICRQEHNMEHYAELEASADYLTKALQNLGYRVNSHPYKVGNKTVRNLSTEIRGTTHPSAVLVIGAHYDSVVGSPGANDNGSGVAAILEIARLLKQHKPPRTVRFAFFVNEEPPYFETELMGSRVYVQGARANEENIVAMISMETIGYYSDQPNSQQYPPPLSSLYPSTGNFIGFVANLQSRHLLRKSIERFRANSNFPSEGVSAPGSIPGIAWSDHASFWEAGYPALMLTDTALFRYPYYHTARDTPDKLDYSNMAQVVLGVSGMLKDLADPKFY